jgi:hypothetical protein
MKTLKNHYLALGAIAIIFAIAFSWNGFVVLTTQWGWWGKALALAIALYFIYAVWIYFCRWLDMAMTKAYQEGFENASLDRQHYGEKKYMDGWLDCQKKIKK